MPGRFLTDAERERLTRFPAEVPPEDLVSVFTLSPKDITKVLLHRGQPNYLGFGLQMCALRYLGFAPDDLSTAPSSVVKYVARQLGVSPEALKQYGTRPQTRTDHLQEILSYLEFREANATDLQALAAFVLERALEHDKPIVLFQMACEYLKSEHIVRPGVTTLERMVITAREQAERETYRRLEPLLTEEFRARLDQVLEPPETTKRTPLVWLRQGAVSFSPAAIVGEIEKLSYVRGLGVEGWDLSTLTPNRRKFLSQVGKKSTNQALQRTAPSRRYPILVAFLRQVAEELMDEIMDLFDRCMAQVDARARRDLEEFRRNAARAINEKVTMFTDLTGMVLDPQIADPDLRTQIYKRHSKERLQAAMEESARLMRPADDNYFDFLTTRYTYVRQFAPAFLSAFTFRANRRGEPLVEAVSVLNRIKRKVPENAPVDFMPAKWRPYVLDKESKIDRRSYEMCVLWELRGALRAGNVWLEGSRRYANPETYLIPRDQWASLRTETCRLVQIPESGTERLRERQQELEARLAQFDKGLPRNSQVRMEKGELIVSPLRAEEMPARVSILQEAVQESLPLVELTDLLVEVDSWTHFSRHLEHAGDGEPRTKERLTHLYAAILAQACNLGITAMAQLADLSYEQLEWCTNWYLREETLRPAVTTVVNYQYRLPLSRNFGGGTLSSSDGQRFPVAVKTRNATALPRYFGLGQGLTFFSWTSDQYSQYGSKVAPSTSRDATYVLDEILDNETELPIVEHATDTAGYTEMLFALFDLLGLQFAPRIRDLGEQRLYRMDRTKTYQHIEPLLKGVINQEMITNAWDDLLRVAGSLKRGWVTSSLFISRMQAYPRQNALARALQEYGRLVKTLFILRYLENPDYRRRIHAQLNKGEALHALRQFLFFANQGYIRRHQPEDQANQASCLNLVTNAVVTWNTTYMMDAITNLRAKGHAVADNDLVHLSPALYAHINRYGKYHFEAEATLDQQPRRPLRQPSVLKA
jgi:TnpA family transposase